MIQPVKGEAAAARTDTVDLMFNPAMAPDGWTLEGLDFASFRVSRVAKFIDRLSVRDLGTITDLSMAEWRSLMRIAQASDGITVRQIARGAWVDRAEVSRAVRQLELRGFTDRRDNENDRRAPLLFATEAGKNLSQILTNQRSKFHTRAMRAFSSDERSDFDRLLLKLVVELHQMEAEQ